MLLALHLLGDSETSGLPFIRRVIKCIQNKSDLKSTALQTVFYFDEM